MVVAGNSAYLLTIVPDIIDLILAILSIDPTLTGKVSFDFINDGSVQVGGSVDVGDSATDTDVTVGTATLSAGLQGQTIGGQAVESVSTTSNGVTTTDSNDGGSGGGLVIIAAAVAVPVVISTCFVTQLSLSSSDV